MIVAIVAAVTRTTDHVPRQRAEACAHGYTAKIPADEAARDTATHSTYHGASAGRRAVVTGGKRKRRAHNGK